MVIAHFLAKCFERCYGINGLSISRPWAQLGRLVICQGSDHRDGLLSIERQQVVFILQHHHRLESHLPRDFSISGGEDVSLFAVRVAVRVIEQSRSEFHSKHTANCFIDRSLGQFSGFHQIRN